MILGFEWYMYVAFFLVGMLASVINSIAGGGSTISLPIMIGGFLSLTQSVSLFNLHTNIL